MSMSAYPEAGFVVELNKFLDLLVPKLDGAGQKTVTELKEMNAEGDLDEDQALKTVKRLCKKVGILPPDEVFHLTDEDFPCDLEYSVNYVRWAQDSLFEIKPKPALAVLQSMGIEPLDAAWATWG